MGAVRFTEEDIERLAYERFHHPHPRVQRKLEGVLLKAKGFLVRDICDVVGCCPNTLRSWLRDFEAGGVDGLTRWDSGGKACELDPYTDAICDHLNEHPPHTIAEAAGAIEQLTGVRRCQTQVGEYLKRVGFKRLKTGSLPAKADPAAQAAFKKASCCPA
ncbi:helix-turn-helix domain-containing protein [Pirellulimonas nuda]|uniref:helix-turn-helix domain-containing protein n=1 Tax=Pirellulimonas nuda TaxID=2528009 RepID=UPI0011A3EFC1|nr:winged helix-turn-helix domain-containing protein [Pirellulimonas nuda]